ncbi:Retrovirus-related Pol polyprotein from transposon TNT 1-94 [Sesamum angolense]|uniref:Retrovirus-related Pol polyprotein from transposon TNT 1-94 n=1 Tax=Sesamum angolense TaxID=2727404 RepID=A0AAE1T4P6_9LAMI|nr:Retrovirus-related Pol polyprotein from transposon TNT 1-94 [Sesamum angolense]
MWICREKLKPNGTIDKLKAKLVAKDFKQNEGIDHFDTYSPVAWLTTIQVFIAFASVYNLLIHQMDVKTTFLYVELDEEIYMNQPEGFVAHDDILSIGSCLEIIIETKSFLKNKFEIKDMGEADVILGIKLIRSTDEIVISQSHYVEKIIEKFGYQNSRIAKTPYDASVTLFKNESGFAIAQLRTRRGALDRVLRYLKGTVSLTINLADFLLFLRNIMMLVGQPKTPGVMGVQDMPLP